MGANKMVISIFLIPNVSTGKKYKTRYYSNQLLTNNIRLSTPKSHEITFVVKTQKIY